MRGAGEGIAVPNGDEEGAALVGNLEAAAPNAESPEGTVVATAGESCIFAKSAALLSLRSHFHPT